MSSRDFRTWLFYYAKEKDKACRHARRKEGDGAQRSCRFTTPVVNVYQYVMTSAWKLCNGVSHGVTNANRFIIVCQAI